MRVELFDGAAAVPVVLAGVEGELVVSCCLGAAVDIGRMCWVLF